MICLYTTNYNTQRKKRGYKIMLLTGAMANFQISMFKKYYSFKASQGQSDRVQNLFWTT